MGLKLTLLCDHVDYAYDALGRQVAVTDPLGHTITTAYDAEERVRAQRGATYPVDYAYDAYGNKVAMTTYRDEELVDGDTTRWLYDEPSGCMTNKVYADGKGPSYDYTPDGKLARRVWARGIATDYTYDNAGNLTRTEYDDNGVTPTISMTYDRVGNLTEATTAGVVTNLYAYDIVGHCTNEWQNDFNLTRYYDTLGRSTGYAINGTRQTTIAYDTYGRIATMRMAEGRSGVLTASNENEFVWSYLPNSDLKASLQYPNGLTASWTYDANNQLLQVHNATPTNVISQFDYTYDAAGRRTAIAKSGSAFGDLSGSIDSYTYNARSELTSARRTKNGQPIPGFSEDFDYDPIGNRRSSSTYNERGEAQTSTYEANNLNQYTSRTTPGYAAVRGEADPNATVTVNENPTFRLGSYYFGSDLFDNSSSGGLANLETYATLAQTAANGEETEDLVSATTNQVYLAQSPETFAYDDDGNQTLITTKTGLWRVTYNGENRPIRWERDSDNQILTMSYDHMGRRYNKCAQSYFYDNYLQIANGQPLSVDYLFFTWDPTGSSSTCPIVRRCGNLVVCYVHDGNKNVSEVVETGFSKLAHYEYTVFGEVVVLEEDSPLHDGWKYSSEYADDELGVVYYAYREYASQYGRWFNRDPLCEASTLSIYAFKDNRLNGYDAFGLWTSDGHKTLTNNAFDQVKNQVFSSSENVLYALFDQDKILNAIRKANVETDGLFTTTGGDQGYHYCRSVSDMDSVDYKRRYQDYLKSYEKAFTDLLNENPPGCSAALEKLGLLSHMWQDYYGHGVERDDKKAVIGRIKGSPDNLLMTPVSFGLLGFRGSHGGFFRVINPWTNVEPGDRAPDASTRREKATTYTKNKFLRLLASWAKACVCDQPWIRTKR